MKLQRLASCFVLLIALLSLANSALASCPTTQQGPPCSEYWRTEAVFIGVAMTYTGKDGRFRFTRLAPGSYLLMINQTESDKSGGSEISRALPRLFYPGVSDLGGATVIVVGREHEPREYDFRLPIH
jgi:hypothetical protein